ncbi:MAG TPA: molybdopterin molybdenumtransferase MoeA, partial [Anaerolineae bacterium]
MATVEQKPLISVEDALVIILDQIAPVDTERITLSASFNRVLAEAIVSPIDVPSFANSAMDGYAVIAADTQNASRHKPVTLKVIDNIPAGALSSTKLSVGTTARIMTGAPVPKGADAVVRFEETSEN